MQGTAPRPPTELGSLRGLHETVKYRAVRRYLYYAPADARQKRAAHHRRYNVARPHCAGVAGDPATAPARILTPYEVYVKGYAVAPPSWSWWVGRLDEQDRGQAAEPRSRTSPRASV